MYAGIEILGDIREDCLREHALQTTRDEEGTHSVIDTDALKPLGIEFRRYIWDRIPEGDEWESTSIFMQYLAMDVVEIRLLGLRPDAANRPQWGLDILFCSCGGTCEESARLAAHWAEIWYKDEKQCICDECLVPFGFLPSNSDPNYIGTADIEIPPTRAGRRAQRCPLFVPIAGGSYAAFDPNRKLAPDDSPFQLDCALADSLPDGGRQLLAELESCYGDALTDGRCRCQLCAPDLDPGGVRCRTG